MTGPGGFGLMARIPAEPANSQRSQDDGRDEPRKRTPQGRGRGSEAAEARFCRAARVARVGAIRAELGRRNRGTNLSIIANMTRARNAALILLCVLLAASASAQPKGNARINGKILDDQGKPAPGGSGSGGQGRRLTGDGGQDQRQGRVADDRSDRRRLELRVRQGRFRFAADDGPSHRKPQPADRR